MGSAIPMDAGGVDTQAAHDDAGSLGARGVGPGLGKGGAYRAPESYDKHTNNGFPSNTCGGCVGQRTITETTVQ